MHQCRREPEAALAWADATIAAAQELGYSYREAMGRVLRGWALSSLGDTDQGVREITEGLAALARHRRAHGRPALPRRCWPTRSCARARSTPGSPPSRRRSSSRGRERSLFYEPELHRIAGALLVQAGEPADGRARACARGSPVRASRARRALELRLATDLARLAPDSASAAEARAAVALAFNAFEEGHGTRDLREAAAVLGLAPAQAIAPAPASASTRTPSATR